MIKDLLPFELITKQLVDKLNFLRKFQLNKSYIELHLINSQFNTQQELRQQRATIIKDLKRKTKSLNEDDEKSLLNAYSTELDFCYEFLVEDQTNLEESISTSTRTINNIYLIHRICKKQVPVLQAYKVLHLNIINLRRSLSKRNVAKYLLKHLTQVAKTIKTKFSCSMEDHSTSSCESLKPSSIAVSKQDEKCNNIIEDNQENIEVIEDISYAQVPCQKSDSGKSSTLELKPTDEQFDEKSASNTEYIQNRLGQPLRKALAYLVVHQPSDPILILANFLLKYRFSILSDLVTLDESEALMQERVRVSAASEMAECDPCSRYLPVD